MLAGLNYYTVRGHNEAAHMHSIFAHSLDQQEVVNTVLNGLGILCLLLMQVVIALAFAVINIRVGLAFALSQIMTLNPSDGLFFEFIHVQQQK